MPESQRALIVVSEEFHFHFDATTPTLVAAASCRRRFRKVFLVGTFTFLRHLLSEWFCPRMRGRLLVAWDTFNQRDTRHIQQSAGGEWRNASGSQFHSFRFRLQLCAQSYHMVTAHLDRHAADLPSDPPMDCHFFLLTNAIFAVQVISRPRAPRIILQSPSDGNYELTATCWSLTQWWERVCMCV